MSDVFFIKAHSSARDNLMYRLKIMLKKAGTGKIFNDDTKFVGIKTHFGEYGNTAYIRPVFLREIINNLRELSDNKNIEFFLTETSTIYTGTRSNAPAHIANAIYNGFSFASMQVPIIIADGLNGEAEIEVKIPLKKSVKLGLLFKETDSIVMISHFKGHMLSGFGGAIKNMSMGCSSRSGKFDMHSAIHPKIIKKRCTGCGKCLTTCNHNAMFIKNGKINIDSTKCTGCAECLKHCPHNALDLYWDREASAIQERMVEYALGLTKLVKNIVYINFLINITPDCDCFPFSDEVIAPDIGIMLSFDPVSIDKACLDMVITKVGRDVFKEINPDISHQHILEYADSLGLGEIKYKLITIER